MIRPDDLAVGSGDDTWLTLVAASAGDVSALRQLIERSPPLAHAEYWYSPAVHFAAREGHVEAVQILLEAGADPEWNGLNDRSLIEMARERGHEQIAQLLERERDRRGCVVAQPSDHAIHTAATRGDVEAVRALLDADPGVVNLGDFLGGTPLHCAVLGSAREVVTLLLDRDANVHAVHGSARGLGGGLVHDLQAIDFALWGGRRQSNNHDIARLLVSRGATYDVTVATALGDLASVRQMLDNNPSRIREARPSGRRPLAAAVEFGQEDIARLLLERGADPRWDEPMAPRGASLHSAAAWGNLALAKLLLEHGADPNEEIDSAASAVAFAYTSEVRELLLAHGAAIPPDDAVFYGDDDEVIRRFREEPGTAGSAVAAFMAACTMGKGDLLVRLFDLGLRVPPVLHPMSLGHVLGRAEMLAVLLAHGMDPDVMNWQRQTLLHYASNGNDTERAAILLDAGANITARDDEYRSTPLAWAARSNAPNMVQFLLSRGAPTHLSDDEPWATPLAWATRRGHTQIVEMLRAAGAVS